ncbi:MAG: hypothetical protein ACJA0H_000598 [Francisellaceae bacterium]|jgi:hypothetical protein
MLLGIILALDQNTAISFLDGLIVRHQGTLHNQSEEEVIYVLKHIIMSKEVDVPTDEISLQDIIALVLNKMVPRYRVVSARSAGRNLVTYYKLQEESKLSGKIKKALKTHILSAIKKVMKSPHT